MPRASRRRQISIADAELRRGKIIAIYFMNTKRAATYAPRSRRFGLADTRLLHAREHAAAAFRDRRCASYDIATLPSD